MIFSKSLKMKRKKKGKRRKGKEKKGRKIGREEGRDKWEKGGREREGRREKNAQHHSLIFNKFW